MKSESWLIIQFGAALLILGMMSFFKVPAYEKGAWFVMGGFWGVLNMIVGYKFGRSMPQQASDPKPGQTSQSTVTTQVPDILPEKPNGE